MPLPAKINSANAKKVVKSAYLQFDMCVSAMFSPFAGILYTISSLEKMTEKQITRPASPPVGENDPEPLNEAQRT